MQCNYYIIPPKPEVYVDYQPYFGNYYQDGYLRCHIHFHNLMVYKIEDRELPLMKGN